MQMSSTYTERFIVSAKPLIILKSEKLGLTHCFLYDVIMQNGMRAVAFAYRHVNCTFFKKVRYPNTKSGI